LFKAPVGSCLRTYEQLHAANDIVVAILDRPWNKAAVEEFRIAGATVRLIPVGDFEEHLRAGRPVTADRPICVSYGIGGLPEGFLAAPFLRWTGASMLLTPVPLGAESSIREKGEIQVFDTFNMIDSNDCVLAVAGVSNVDESDLVPGVCYDDEAQTLSVKVFVSSPMFEQSRLFTVSFGKTSPRQMVETLTLQEKDVVRLLTSCGTIETVLKETSAGDVEFAHWPFPALPGRAFDESRFLEILHCLQTSGIVERKGACL
jgi:hypothetical protein